jgi:hypothetical protein
MISLNTARRLKETGLVWQPAEGDRFAVPDRGLDDRRFIVNDMATMIELVQGEPSVTFHGTPEWALDYLWLGETIWLPSEEQLRLALQERLVAAGTDSYDLLFADGVCLCRFEFGGAAVVFSAPDAAEAYAAALLHVLARPTRL